MFLKYYWCKDLKRFLLSKKATIAHIIIFQRTYKLFLVWSFICHTFLTWGIISTYRGSCSTFGCGTGNVCKNIFSYSRNWTKNKNHPWDWDCHMKIKWGGMESLWCQVDFSYLCGPISVWILARRSAILFPTRLERWWQNISDHSQNSNKISPARWLLINFMSFQCKKILKTGSSRIMFTTIKFPASHGRQFRNFIGILPDLTVWYVLVGLQQDKNLIGLCEH